MRPKISVLMLTYNREALVARAIESVLAQTMTDYEFIIVNNGSTDNSGIIANEYTKKDSRIKVLHRKRGSIGAGRNTALDTAVGEYIAFFDDDDWAEPDFLEFLYCLAVNNNADISICGAKKRVYDEKWIMNSEEAIIKLLWRKHYNVQFPTKLIKRELFNELRFIETAKYDDIELMPYLLARAKILVYHGLPKYTFYRHGGNNSIWTTDHSRLDSQTLDEYLKVYRKRTEWLCKLYPSNVELWRYFEWSFMISLVDKIVILSITGCDRQLMYMVAELQKYRSVFLQNVNILDFEKKWMDEYVS